MTTSAADRSLVGHRAVLVGVSAPLGVACAMRLATDGAELHLADWNQSGLDRASAALAEHGLVASALCTPVDAAAGASRLAEYCAGVGDTVDILVVTAGVVDWWLPEDDPRPWWEDAVRENILVPVLYTEAVEPWLVRSGRSSVVYYGSIDGIRGNPLVPVYSVTRGALIPWTHIVAHRLGPHGGRANVIAGASLTLNGPDVPTGMRATWDLSDALRRTPLGRLADPAEAADVIAYLAGPRSSYITGSVLTMDGGRTAITPGTV